jgi:hypothetical protein
LKGGEFIRSRSCKFRRLDDWNSLTRFFIDLPKLGRDLKARLDRLADEPVKITNPFDSVYEIVFQLTMRTVGCNEIADDPKLLSRSMQYNRTIELGATPGRIMFPWFPTPALFRQFYAGAGLYSIFDKIIKQRKKEDRREDDALQIYIDHGDSTKDIISVSLSHIFGRLLFLTNQYRW